MNVSEIFLSIQGETSRAGELCAFVRLAGCNLSCAWCDTRHARKGGTPMEADQVVAALDLFGTRLVCVTGGEPLLQDETGDLARRLLAEGHEVMLMTNGSLPLDPIPGPVLKVVDVKTPWSHRRRGGKEGQSPISPACRLHAPRQVREMGDCPSFPPHLLASNLDLLGRRDEVKFVVRVRQEFDWAAAWASSVGLFDRVEVVSVGPAWGELDPAAVVEWMKETRSPFRLNLQIHKYVWGK